MVYTDHTCTQRVKKNISQFSTISEQVLDTHILHYFERHNRTTGKTLLVRYIRSLCIRVQRSKIWKALVRLDPKTTALRWGIVTTHREYYVPWPNSPWHLDGHHFLIRWGFVIHGFIDEYSRKVIFLECSNNNLFKLVLILSIDAIKNDGGRWPSKTRIDYDVKKLLVCDKMVEKGKK